MTIFDIPTHPIYALYKCLTDKDPQHPIKWRRPGDPQTNRNPRSTNVIARLSKKQLWKQLGYNFRVDVDRIQMDNGTNEEGCSRSVFDQWMRGQVARGKPKDERPRVWATVISALRETQEKPLVDLASEVKHAISAC